MDADPPRRRFRFSLRALLLVTAFAALVASHTYTSYTAQQLREENLLLRQEVERLPISDESRLHVAALLSPDRLTWRWRVYVPTDRSFFLRTEHGDNIPQTGLSTPLGLGRHPLPPGEYIITVTAYKERSGSWTLMEVTPDMTQRFDIPLPQTNWIDKQDYTGQAEPRDGVRAVPPEEPTVLLRARETLVVSGVRADNPQPTNGVMVWIEEQ